MPRGISTNRYTGDIAGCLQREHVEFVCRYYSTTTTQPQKRLTVREANALLDKGVKLVAVYEDGPTDAAYFSAARGERDGRHAHQYALALGQPQGSAIYFAVDYDATAADTHGAIAEYFDGVREGMAGAAGGVPRYTIGVYGSGRVCRHIKEVRKLARYAWLAESHSWAGHDSFTMPDIRQEIARTPLCSLSPGVHGDFEDNFADGDYGAFTTLQAHIDSMLRFAAEHALHTDAPSEFATRVAELAAYQYQRYHVSSESESPLKEQIGVYWTDLGYAFPGTQTAWSAVFISWLMKTGGASAAEFRFSNAHSRFVHWAIKNARADTGLFRAYPIDAFAPRVGDLIHNNRGNQTLDYDFAAAHEAYESHSALVVALGKDARGNHALTVGGNEGDTVGRKRVQLRPDGKVAQRASNPYICVVRNLK